MMKMLAFAIVTLSAGVSFSAQVLRCVEVTKAVNKYSFRAVLTPTSNNHYGLSMTLTEPGAGTVKLDTLYSRFGAGPYSDVPFSKAMHVNFAGFKDRAGLRFDAYHIQFPINYWGKIVESFYASGWFQDAEFGAGLSLKFKCYSEIRE